MLRILIIAVLAVLIVIGAALGYVLTRDPNAFTEDILTLIQDNTGLEAKLGNLGWRLWPPLVIEADAVSAGYPQRPQLVAIERLALNVRVLPLLSTTPRIEVASIAIDGVEANLVRDSKGVANWEAPASASTPTPAPDATTPPSAAPALLPFAVDSFRASGSARYSDAIADTHYTISRFSIETSGAGINRAFPLVLELAVSDATGLVVTTDATATVNLPAALDVVTLEDIEAKGTVQLSADADTGAFDLKVPKANFVMASGNLTAPDFSGHLAAATLNGSAALNGDSGVTSGQLNVDTRETGQLLGLVMNPATLPLPERLQFSSPYALGPERLEFASVQLNADGQTIGGSLGVGYPEGGPYALDFAITAKALNLDPYLQTSSGSMGAAAAPVAEALLPVDTFATTHWNGTAAVGTLQASGQTFSNVKLSTRNDGNSLLLDTSAGLLGGTVAAKLDTTALQAQPNWRMTLDTRNVQGATLVDMFAPGWEFEGPLTVTAGLTARGNTMAELERTARGPIRFNAGEGQLNISAIKSQAAAIATLAGRGESASKWPDVLDYKRFTGELNLDDGLGKQRLQAALENLVIAGTGSYALASNSIAYDATITVENDPRYHSFDLNEYLVGIPIPVRCEGALGGTTRLCGLNANSAQQVIAKALTGAAGDKARASIEKTIDEKLPEQYREAAKGFLDLLGRPRSN